MMGSRGYDMTPTMYSPDGRIYQVEYAIETVKRGAIAIGLQVKDGIILAVEEKSRDLQVEDITQKIFQVDDHIGIAAAGYIPDARVMVDSARFFSQSNKLTYDESVEIETVAKHLADQSHQFTQYSGVRPFGVALIIAGVDTAIAYKLQYWVERTFKIEDAVGAVAVHGYAGVVGLVICGFVLWGYPSSGYGVGSMWVGTDYAPINPLGMIIGAIIMFGVLGFLPGWILAKILHSAGKLRIPRDVELAGLDYNIMEQAQKDERAVASSNR